MPEKTWKDITTQMKSLRTQWENLAAVAESHAAQPNAMLKEKELATRLRVAADQMNALWEEQP